MNEKVTSLAVARRAGVSQSAVSRVFTPGASASKATIAKVRKAADAWVLCLQVQTELGGAPEQGQICREGVDALVERLKPAAP